MQPPQGIAHLVEHVTFLGSKKRESLLGTGARANAYTDFHHTVFHVHAPLVNGITGAPMLPQARVVFWGGRVVGAEGWEGAGAQQAAGQRHCGRAHAAAGGGRRRRESR
jgi:hypothetical protein